MKIRAIFLQKYSWQTKEAVVAERVSILADRAKGLKSDDQYWYDYWR